MRRAYRRASWTVSYTHLDVYKRQGTGKVTINKRDIDEYFGLETLKLIVRQPLAATQTADKFDVLVNVRGGGTTGQAGAIRHGISRALLQADAEFRPTLKAAGFLTRDPRMKERKKYGLKAARRAPQFLSLIHICCQSLLPASGCARTWMSLALTSRTMICIS